MADRDQLQSKFDEYYLTAKQAVESGDLRAARENYAMAADVLLKIADLSNGQEKRNKVQEVRVIAELVQTIDRKLKAAERQQHVATTVAGGVEKSPSVEESRFDVVDVTGVSFDDVVGCEDIKDFVTLQWIKRFDPKYQLAFSDALEVPMERGMLLYGCPGTGKTMMAQAIATEVKCKFYSINAKDVKDKYVGETEKAIVQLFEEASRCERAIIFIDEVDSMLTKATSNTQSHERSALHVWQTMMDGFDKDKVKNVICIGATNYPWDIAPPALRPKRLGVHMRVDLPNYAVREKVLRKKLGEGAFILGDYDNVIAYAAISSAGYNVADIGLLASRIISIGQTIILDMVDKGIELPTSQRVISFAEAKRVIDGSNSSVSLDSVAAITEFERNLAITNQYGSASEYMEYLQREATVKKAAFKLP